ncbi:hypothetical protein C8R44DRAFT_982874 [Mycena epipterygia]|nr:hypothetical protein C8R44DRAFT_982874 [Mycena epipterygia]
MGRTNKKNISEETKQHVILYYNRRRKQADIAADLRAIRPAARDLYLTSAPRCLLLLEDQDKTSVDLLLNPNNLQDMPRAIDLLKAIVALCEQCMVINAPISNVELNSNLDCIGLFSYMVEALLNVFMVPSALLSFQLENLSLYAHLTFVCFHTYRLVFMSNQLYGDSQMMVKNIFFTIAKQKLLNPSGKVNAYEDEADPVEEYFGYMHELGGHNSAMNLNQAVEQSASMAYTIVIRASMWGSVRTMRSHRCQPSGSPSILETWTSQNHQNLEQYSWLPLSAYDFNIILAIKNLDFCGCSAMASTPGILDNLDCSLPPQRTVVADTLVLMSAAMGNTLSAPSNTAPVPVTENTTMTDVDSMEDIFMDLNVPTISFEELLQSEPSEPTVLKLESRPSVHPKDYLLDSNALQGLNNF